MERKTNVEDIYPVSPVQEGMLFHTLYAPGAGMYIDQLSCRLSLRGAATPAVFRPALERVIERHTALRTAFAWELRERPHQVVLRRVQTPVTELDWRNASAAGQEEYLAALLKDERLQGFDLTRAPLLRLTLIRLAEREYFFVFSYHHILMDAWSTSLIFKELFALCSAWVEGRETDLSPTRPFRTYIDWLQRRDRAGWEIFWRGYLRGFSAPTPVGVDRGLGDAEAGASGDWEVELPAEVSAALGAFVKRFRLTLSNLVQATWALLLMRRSGEPDVVFGTTVSGRPYDLPGVESMVGLFINTVPVRCSAGRETLVRWLEEFQRRQFELRDYEHTPLVQVQGWSELPRGVPLFDSLLVFENVPVDSSLSRSAGPFSLVGGRYDPKTNYPLTLLLVPGERISIRALFDRARFDPSTVARLCSHFRNLLAALSVAPEALSMDLPLLDEAERHQLLTEWNDTAAGYPFLPVHGQVLQRARATPAATAVVFEDRTLEYGELGRRVARLAQRLRSLGVGPGRAVAVALERSENLPVALLAVLASGAAYVPLDPAYPYKRLEMILEDIAAAVLVTEEALLGRLPSTASHHVLLDREAGTMAAEDEALAPAAVEPDRLAYVIYTSGSTGRPKGVGISHGALANFLAALSQRLAIGPGDALLAVTSISFDIAGLELFLPLVCGACVVIASRDMAMDGTLLAREIERRSVRFLQATPVSWRLLLDSGGLGDRRLIALCGGEALPRDLADRILETTRGLWNLYGPTETTIWSAAERVQPGAGAVPIGRPIGNTSLYVLDAVLSPVPIGIPGRLYIGGAGLARGYHGRPDLAAEKFLPAPFAAEPGSRMYWTGDLARFRPEGSLEFLGRVDHQIKLRGFRIELAEIEAVLEKHPAVRQAVVQVRGNGEGGQRLVAYVERDGHRDAPPAEEWHGERIAEWRNVWSETYRQRPVDQAPTLNLAGWNSSYTGHPLTTEEMSEWVEHTVKRIRELHPSRILEIGCGTGLLLFRLLPDCAVYWGTDFSREALDHVVRNLPAADRSRVHLLERAAHDVSGLEAGSFDLVLLNSVVQYFPDVEYFLHVLDGISPLVRKGGHVFLGDLRSLPCLEAFHASVQLFQAEPEMGRDLLARRIQDRVLQDGELVLDPALFYALPWRLPAVAGVRVELKPGMRHNELTRFRYDVTLSLGVERVPAAACNWLDWRREGLTLSALRQRLAGSTNPVVGIRRVPNARLLDPVAAARLAASREGPATVAAIRRQLASVDPVGIEPEDLWALGREVRYEVEIGWSQSGELEEMDAVFRRPGTVEPVEPVADGAQCEPQWRSWARSSRGVRRARQIVSQLRRLAEESLPEYMVPAAFVILETLPLTPNGKVDRRSLPEPESEGGGGEVSGSGPRTPTEELLLELWKQILGLADVGLRDHFFERGGHSLLATQLVSRVRKTFGVELPLRSVFDAPTPGELAAKIEEALSGGQTPRSLPIERRPRDGELPLSFAQQRLWLVAQVEPDSPAYNIPAALRFTGRFDAPVLARVLNEIVRRHEVLRTTFSFVEGRPVQVIAVPSPLPLPRIDLEALPEPGRTEEARCWMAREAVRPFDLERGPLLRIALLCLGAGDHVLFFVVHHIVVDIWSVAVFAREVSVLYAAFRQGLASPLPELSVQYIDFAAWQRDWLRGEVLDRQLAYWKQRLGFELPDLKLPFELPGGSSGTLRGGSVPSVLPSELAREIGAFSRREGATLFMTLLAAFKALLHHETGQTDLVVGTDVANRNRAETEELIGFFVNILALRTDLSGNPTFRQLLRRVRETALGAYTHQDLPFEILVRALRPDRTLSPSPLFRVLFVLQNAPREALSLPDAAMSFVEVDTRTSKFDIAVFLEETAAGIAGRWTYKSDLFDRQAIKRLSGRFRRLLESLTAKPDTRLDEIDDYLIEEDKGKAMDRTAQQQDGMKRFERFKKVKPKGVNLDEEDLVRTSFLAEGSTFPLVVEPAIQDVSLVGWAEGATRFIEERLREHGAILFRGFDIGLVADFERFAQTQCPELFGDYGDLPPEDGGQKVYCSTPYPEDKAILFHNESSHMHRWPMRQFFCCLLPSESGGETPIVDCRGLYRHLNGALREQFASRGLKYVRNFSEGFDVSWQEFFRTSDRAEVEAYCRRAGIHFEWTEDGLRTEQLCPGVARHPRTGDMVFFNQIQLHHVSCLDREVRESIQSLFSEDRYPRNVYYGDGTPIADEVVAEILDLYWKSSVDFPWQRGDILMLDNMLVAHARKPFRGARKIVVAMGDMFDKGNLGS